MREHRAIPKLAALAVVICMALIPSGGPARASAEATAAPSERCRQVTFPVAMTENAPADQWIAGSLCLPPGGPAYTLQMLIPGGTYGQAYWFLRGDWRRPSYVEAMTGAGYATLAIDRLGAGASSAPSFDRYAPDTQQAIMAQLVRTVRQNGVDGHSFARLVLVGHSYGATLARTVAIHQPDDVDGLILTAEATAWVEIPWDEVIHSAVDDPKFASRDLDPAYYTTRPGARGIWFYHSPNAEPWVVALDELTKEVDVYTEEFPLPNENAAIRIPVLIVVGDRDRLICGAAGSDCSSSQALLRQEKPWYPNAPLQVEVVPATGHALNLHRSAPRWMGVARDWVDRVVGTGGR